MRTSDSQNIWRYDDRIWLTDRRALRARVFTRKRVFLVKSSETPSVRPSARASICGRTVEECGRGRKSWWLTFYKVTHKLVQGKSPAVKSDTEPMAMTAKGLHDPIVNQYRPRHRMCGCCWPAARAADCGEIVNAYGVSDMVVL